MGVPFYNVDPDKYNQKNNGVEGQGSGSSISGDQSLVSGSASGAPQGQPGTGGQIPFTNIQSYLSANPEGGGGDKVLAKTVGDEIGAVQSDAQKSYDEFNKSVDAANAGIKSNVGDLENKQRRNFSESFSKNLSGADLQGGNQDTYSAVTNELRDYGSKQSPALNQYYKSATPKLQQYQQGVSGDDTQFKGLINQLYSNAAKQSGATMGSGAMALQEQLDSGQKLTQQREKAKGDISSLNSKLDSYNNAAKSKKEATESSIKSSKNAATQAANKFDQDRQALLHEFNTKKYNYDYQNAFGDPQGSREGTLPDILKAGKVMYGDKRRYAEADGTTIRDGYANLNPTVYIGELLRKYGFSGDSLPNNLSSNPEENKPPQFRDGSVWGKTKRV